MIEAIKSRLGSFKIGVIISLSIIYLSMFTGWYWLWGILLLYWATLDLIYDQCWLTQIIYRHQNPILYFLIVITWLTLGFYFILSPVIYLLR